jgi:hypothetical protein
MSDARETKELRDAYTMQALVALKTIKAPSNGRILLMASLPLNESTFKEIGQENTDVLSLDHVVGNILVNCSENAGLGPVVDDFIGFEGSEMYIGDEVPKHLLGVPFQFAPQYYPQAVVLGCVHAATGGESTKQEHIPEVCIAHDYRLAQGDRLLLLAENSLHLTPKKEQEKVNLKCFKHELMDSAQVQFDVKPTQQENILFVGWSQTVGVMILKLDRVVKKGSKVYSFNSTATSLREQKILFAQERYDETINNIDMVYVEGDLGSRWQLDDLGDANSKHQYFDWKDITRVFIIMEQAKGDPWKADALSMTIALQLRDTLEKHQNGHIPIVMELQSMHSEEQVKELGFQNYVVSSSIPSKVMATVARQPKLSETLRKVFSNIGNPVTLRRLDEYIPLNILMKSIGASPNIQTMEELEECDQSDLAVFNQKLMFNFFQLSAIVAMSGDVLIGWTELEGEHHYEHDAHKEIDEDNLCHLWEINPQDKTAQRHWHVVKTDKLDVDKLAVIAGSAPKTSGTRGGLSPRSGYLEAFHIGMSSQDAGRV